MVDPRIAYNIDGRHLRLAVPRLNPGDLHALRGAFARYLTTPAARRDHATWQDAWNAWTGSTPNRQGRVEFTTAHCPDCKGRRVNTSAGAISRSIARHGNPYICSGCSGTGRGKRLNLNAIHIPAPSAEDTTQDPAQDPTQGAARETGETNA